MAPPPPDGGSSDEAPSEKPKSSYPEEFELAWREYPKRAGGNSKVDAFKAWTARIKSGATAQELTDGVRRYADYVTAAGKLNTEYVKQASTFSVPQSTTRSCGASKYQPVNGIRTQYPSQIN